MTTYEPSEEVVPEETLVTATDALQEMGNNQPSLMERLRSKHEEAGKNTTVDIDLPYYDGEIFARYHLLDGKRLEMITDRAQRSAKDQATRAMYAAMDTIIAACDEILARDRVVPNEDGSPRIKSIAEIMGIDTPVRYDEKLAEFFNFDSSADTGARGVLLKVFGHNEVAIANHNIRLSRWMADPSRDPASGLLGEILG